MTEKIAIRVSIVDDSDEDAETIENLLNKYSASMDVEFECKRFCNGNDFLKTQKKPDVVFLDIDMPGMNGLELAKKIRQVSGKVLIIFCTNLEQYAINGYEVNAIGYLLKPVDPYWFDFVMNKVCAALRVNRRSVIVVKSATEQVLINISEIVYIEVQLHTILYYTYRGGKLSAVKSRGSMREVSEKLSNSQFARCSSCYLVNLRKIISVKKNKVTLPGVELPISRTFRDEFNEKFMQFLSRFEV